MKQQMVNKEGEQFMMGIQISNKLSNSKIYNAIRKWPNPPLNLFWSPNIRMTRIEMKIYFFYWILAQKCQRSVNIWAKKNQIILQKESRVPINSYGQFFCFKTIPQFPFNFQFVSNISRHKNGHLK